MGGICSPHGVCDQDPGQCMNRCHLLYDEYGLTPKSCYWICTGREWSPAPGLNDTYFVFSTGAQNTNP